LDVAPQGKQLIELPELPQPESAGQLWLTVRVVQPNAITSSCTGWWRWMVSRWQAVKCLWMSLHKVNS
ncbi:hypothetical protein CPS93_29165, partial [Klebsiella pneumoniae]